MNRSRILRWVRLAALVIAGAAIACAIAHYRGYAPGNPFALNARYLSDGFFVVGFMMASIGGLVLISTTGFFDIMSYGMHSLLVLFSFLKKPKDHPSYYDYKVGRDARRGKPHFTLLLTGLAFLALAGIFLGIYYQ